MYTSALLLAAAAGLAVAQRPANTSICDFYTTALFTDNTPANQFALLTALVNRAGTGNQTVSPAVTGIVVPGAYNGTDVNLLPYFNAGLASTNRGGNKGVCVNFLDGGANQNTLFQHLYQYFGALLGCSGYGTADFPAYQGNTNMYEVHKFMALDPFEVEYFIQQVGLAAASFGVSDADVQAVGNSLTNAFNFRNSQPAALIPNAAVEPQAICIDPSCPLAADPNYKVYEPVVYPGPCNGTVTATATKTATTSVCPSEVVKTGGCPFAKGGSATMSEATTKPYPAKSTSTYYETTSPYAAKSTSTYYDTASPYVAKSTSVYYDTASPYAAKSTVTYYAAASGSAAASGYAPKANGTATATGTKSTSSVAVYTGAADRATGSVAVLALGALAALL